MNNSVLRLQCCAPVHTHSVTVLLGKESAGNTWWSSMLLHTTFRSDVRIFPPLLGRSSYDLHSDDTAELLLLPPSSTIANNCNRSTLIFTLPHKPAAAWVKQAIFWYEQGRRATDTQYVCYEETWSPQPVKDTFAIIGSIEPSSSIACEAFPELGGTQTDRGVLLCLSVFSFKIPPRSWCVHFLQTRESTVFTCRVCSLVIQ